MSVQVLPETLNRSGCFGDKGTALARRISARLILEPLDVRRSGPMYGHPCLDSPASLPDMCCHYG